MPPPPVPVVVIPASPFDLVLPFLALGAILFPLRWVQAWLLRHLFGLGFLLSKDKRFATLIFYFVLLPGVILHELSRYLIAGTFRIIPTGFQLIPEEQDDGDIEIGFVQFGLIFNPLFAAILDLAPLAVGLFVTTLISNGILHLPDFITHLTSFDIYLIGDAFARLVNRPDFVLWSYVLFAVANTMLPSRNEYRGLLMFSVLCAVVVVLFVILGLPQAVYYLLGGPIRSALIGLTAIFGIILFIDMIAAVALWIIERIAAAVTRREVQYSPQQQAKQSKETHLPLDIYELPLPMPPAPGKLPPRNKTAVTVEKPAQPALNSPLDRRALPSGAGGTNDLSYRSEPGSQGLQTRTDSEPAVTLDSPLRTPARPENPAAPARNLPVPTGGNFPQPGSGGFGQPRPVPKPAPAVPNKPKSPFDNDEDVIEDVDVD